MKTVKVLLAILFLALLAFGLTWFFADRWSDDLDRLAPVWTFRTGETGTDSSSEYKHTFQATPILAGNTLYFSTAFNRVFAIDAENGQERWALRAV